MPFKRARVDQQPLEYKNDASRGRIEVTRRGSRTARSGRPPSPTLRRGGLWWVLTASRSRRDGEDLRNRLFLNRKAGAGAIIARYRGERPAQRTLRRG